ncbi:succinate dehydrogenase, hydrophobic membrane anchor protein [Legionella israelensis]|uniref:Succinate dehydrogenase hydrophobic membrane anchor subunit n=1 Tax=Legionella israelensis TaxID=454 RepID=A0A0W0W1I6_9GAMM|nr:succinate dehydrogenase, hydrophobic membrane anchor protein [Legionella israelensis]KTD26093.1 succinate dehydrogenase, hydrophobic membrane anchor protein [Legionella israelensis]QBR84989.1 succinate dehydrogenase, hydrophobic membrane anchor protein [Legionella israelensis]QBS10120.1 succinate dehydrogenase, hydrophobic membrane anchor protein [Legionella israelensis]QDP73517.1 succinate dehydrogenase, hydrophobic membrane anchor protein [Legionella israelensis]SCY07792.1 succinate dehyd
MVSNVTSLTGNGLKDWLIQRITAVYFAVYSLVVVFYLLLKPQLQYSEWHALFANTWFEIATIIALITLTLHAWIGVWTVTTDYIKSTALRISVQLFIVLWLSAQFIWGLMIVWGQ